MLIQRIVKNVFKVSNYRMGNVAINADKVIIILQRSQQKLLALNVLIIVNYAKMLIHAILMAVNMDFLI